jgi:hypothetical protein
MRELIRRQRRQTPLERGRATRMIGFDAVAETEFDNPVPAGAQPVTMDIFTVPANVTHAEVRRMAVVGHPYGQWYQNVAWSVTTSRGGTQEFISSSLLNQVANDPGNAGMRWAPMGSLQEPMTVDIQLRQGETLGLRFVAIQQTLADAPFTVYARVVGVVFAA